LVPFDLKTAPSAGNHHVRGIRGISRGLELGEQMSCGMHGQRHADRLAMGDESIGSARGQAFEQKLPDGITLLSGLCF
jgi:hypothetical protein